MLKKALIGVFVSILLVLLSYIVFHYLYLTPIKTKALIEFDKMEREIRAVLKYPVPKDYFLSNFEIMPSLEGDYSFEQDLGEPLRFLGYKELRFKPETIDFEKIYKIKSFDKELTFSLPSPKPREISFLGCVSGSNDCQQGGNITITFFDPIGEDYFLEKFKVYKCETQKCENISGEIKEYSFSDSNKKIIAQVGSIEEDKNYKVEILGKNLSFKIESPKIKTLFFNKTRKEVVMTFTKSIEEERFFQNFKVFPQLKGDFVFEETGERIVFKPYSIEERKKYRIEVLGRTLIVDITPPAKPKTQPTLSSRDKLIEVDVSRQRLWLHHEGKVIAEYLTSTGASGMPTPTGTFRVLSKESNHWSATYRLYMPYSLRFYNGYYIHELPYWPGGYREGEDHLGTPVSHGCIRLGIGAAEKVFSFAGIGTKIVIHQ